MYNGMSVYRAVVKSADSTTGDVWVNIPAALGNASSVPITKIGRSEVSPGVWNVPDVGDQVLVAVEDDRFTNVFLVTTAIAENLEGLVINGDLEVTGTATSGSPVVVVGGTTPPAITDDRDRGVHFRWNNGASERFGFFGFDDSTGKFTFIPNASVSSSVYSGAKGVLDANLEWADVLNKPDPAITVTLSGRITGSASTTLTDLTSGSVSIPTVIPANSIVLGTDTTGSYVAGITTSGTGFTATRSGASVNIASNATTANTANTIVARDGYGNFSAGTISVASVSSSGTITGTNITATGSVYVATGSVYVNNTTNNAVVFNNANLGNTTVRSIIASTSQPGVSDGSVGDIWLRYAP